MNYLAKMLMTHVDPALPTPGQRSHVSKPMDHLHLAKQTRTTEKYKAVMGNKWMKTRKIEEALGYGRGASFPWLQQQFNERLMEKRPVGEHYSRKFGYEWRWR